MNQIEINGGNKFQRDIVQKVVGFCIKEMMPRMRTLDIEINLVKIKSDVTGFCMMRDTNRQFEIELSRDLTLKELVTTVAHEMVHVKQYARKELDGFGTRWKNARVKEGTTYWELPWEKEAYRLQDKLAQKIWDADIL